MSAAGKKWMNKVSSLGCCVCRRIGYPDTPAQAHHIGEGSSPRNDFSVAPLCEFHHTGLDGFHTLKEKKFCSKFRVPGEREVGMLVWVNEDIAETL